jgi:hypothetical protein
VHSPPRLTLAVLGALVLAAASAAILVLTVGGGGQDVQDGPPLAVTADTATGTSFPPAELGAPYSWGATPRLELMEVPVGLHVGSIRSRQATLNHAFVMCGPPERYAVCPAEAEARY